MTDHTLTFTHGEQRCFLNSCRETPAMMTRRSAGRRRRGAAAWRRRCNLPAIEGLECRELPAVTIIGGMDEGVAVPAVEGSATIRLEGVGQFYSDTTPISAEALPITLVDQNLVLAPSSIPDAESLTGTGTWGVRATTETDEAGSVTRLNVELDVRGNRYHLSGGSGIDAAIATAGFTVRFVAEKPQTVSVSGALTSNSFLAGFNGADLGLNLQRFGGATGLYDEKTVSVSQSAAIDPNRNADNELSFHELQFFVSTSVQSRETTSFSTLNLTFDFEDDSGEPPELGAIPDVSATPGELIGFEIFAEDPDSTPEQLRYWLNPEATTAGMSIDAATGLFQWTPGSTQIGDFPVTVTVTDDAGNEDSESFTITVSEADFVEWLNANGGSFFVAGNWDSGEVPEDFDRVLFDLDVPYIVRLNDQNAESKSTTISSGTVTLNTGGASYRIAEALEVDSADLELRAGFTSVPLTQLLGPATLVVERDATLLTEQIEILEGTGPAEVVIRGAAGSIGGDTGDRLNIQGSLLKAVDGGILSIEHIPAFVNDGSIQVFGTGSRFEAKSLALQSEDSVIEASGGGHVKLNSATATGDGAGNIGVKVLDAGTLEITGALELSSAFLVVNGGASIGEILSSATSDGRDDTAAGLSLNGEHARLDVSGDLEFHGKQWIVIENGATLTGQTLRFRDVAFRPDEQGIQDKDPAIRDASVELAALTAEGTPLDVSRSTLQVTGPVSVAGNEQQTVLLRVQSSTINASQLTIGAAGARIPDSVIGNSTLLLPQGFQLLGGSVLFLTGSKLNTLGGSVTLEGENGHLVLAPGPDSAATLDSRSLEITNGAKLSAGGEGTRVNIAQSVAVQQNDAIIEIQEGGRLDTNTLIISNDGQLDIDTGGRLQSQSAVLDDAVVFIGGRWENTGTVKVGNEVTEAFTRVRNNGVWVHGLLEVQPGAFIDGTGTFQGSRVHYGGTFNPGNSPGIATFDVDTFELTHTGKLQIDVGGPNAGTDSDQLVVTGEVILNGTLELQFIDGYVPGPNERFNFIVSDAVSGQFEKVTVSGLPAGMVPDLDLTDGGLSFDLVAATGSTVQGRSFDDFNGDGRRQSGEPWMNGWMIQLLDRAGNIVQTQTTGDVDLNGDGSIDPETERGCYRFENLPEGKWYLKQISQSGWRQTGAFDPLAVDVWELDRDHNFRFTGNLWDDWGGLGEKWFWGDSGWYFVTPDGALSTGNGSPATNLTGDEVAQLSAEFATDPALIYDAVLPNGSRVSTIAGQDARDLNFGNQRLERYPGENGAGNGNVTVRVVGTDLKLFGDAQNNGVTIYREPSGFIAVGGHGNTTINGRREPFVTVWAAVPDDLKVWMYGGDDTIGLHNIAVSGNLLLNMGAGSDNVLGSQLLVGEATNVTAAGSAATVTWSNSEFQGAMAVTTGAGSDRFLSRSNIFGGPLRVTTGGGDDLLFLGDSLFGDSVTIHTNGGNDRVGVRGSSRFESGFLANGGAHPDAVDLGETASFREQPSLPAFEATTIPDLETLVDAVLEELADQGFAALL